MGLLSADAPYQVATRLGRSLDGEHVSVTRAEGGRERAEEAAATFGSTSARGALADRVIDVRTMDPLLRGLVAMTVTLLLGGLATVLLKHANLPTSSLDLAGNGTLLLPTPALVLIAVSFGTAWCLAAASALYMNALLRIIVLGGFTLAMIDQGTAFSPTIGGGRGVILVAGLVLLWLVAGLSARDLGGGRSSSPPGRLIATLALAAAVQVAAWWASRASHAGGVFVIGFVLSVTVFAVLATVFIASAGASFASFFDVMTVRLSERLGRTGRWTLPVIAAALTAGLLARALHATSAGLAESTGLGFAAGGLVLLLALRHRPRLASISAPPAAAAVLTGIVITAVIMVASASASTSVQSVDTSVGYVGVFGLAISAIVALTLVAFRLRPALVATALFVLTATLMAGLFDMRQAVNLLAGHAIAGVPHLNFAGIEVAFAAALVVLIVECTLRSSGDDARLGTGLAVAAPLAATVLLLDILFNLYVDAAEAKAFTIGGFAFILAAFVWDLVASGDVTNTGGELVRRQARVLLYMAYLLAASAAVLYYSTGHTLGRLQLEDVFDPEIDTALSVVFTGLGFVTVALAIRLAARGRAAQR